MNSVYDIINNSGYANHTPYLYVRHLPTNVDTGKPLIELCEIPIGLQIIYGVYILLVPNNKPRPRFNPEFFTTKPAGTYILAPIKGEDIANHSGKNTFLLAVDHTAQIEKEITLARHIEKSKLRSTFYFVGNGKYLIHCDDSTTALDIGNVFKEHYPYNYIISQIDPLGLDYVMPTMFDEMMGHALQQIITDPDYTLPEHISARKK